MERKRETGEGGRASSPRWDEAPPDTGNGGAARRPERERSDDDGAVPGRGGARSGGAAAERARGAEGTPGTPDFERRAGEDRRLIEEEVAEERRREERRQADREARARRTRALARVTQGVDYIFYLLYGLLGIRFVLALLGANETAGFVRFIAGITEPFYAPFSGIVARPSVNGGYLDFPLLIALLAYALLHLAIRGLLRMMASEPRP